jgi:hypothetical protein
MRTPEGHELERVVEEGREYTLEVDRRGDGSRSTLDRDGAARARGGGEGQGLAVAQLVVDVVGVVVALVGLG